MNRRKPDPREMIIYVAKFVLKEKHCLLHFPLQFTTFFLFLKINNNDLGQMVR